MFSFCTIFMQYVVALIIKYVGDRYVIMSHNFYVHSAL